MQDPITVQRTALLHPKIREEVLDIYLNQVIPALTGNSTCRFAYTLRTFAEQDALYAQGRTKLFDNAGNRLGIVTKARGGQSLHNYGLAFDIVLLEHGTATWNTTVDYDGDGKSDWMEVINIFKDNGYEWGGDWSSIKDPPHLQKVFGYTWQDLLNLHDAQDFISGTNYVNI